MLNNKASLAVKRKALSIVIDDTHPLHKEFVLLASGKRYNVPYAKNNCLQNSFVPNAVKVLNTQVHVVCFSSLPVMLNKCWLENVLKPK